MQRLLIPGCLAAVLATTPALAQPEPESPEVPADDADDAPADDEVAPEDEAIEGDEELDEDLPPPNRPAPAGKGVIWGNLTDSKHEEPLIEAQVSVVGGTQKTITDYDGNYRLELPPGTYTLRFWYELHKATQIQNVTVALGQVVEVSEKLRPEDEGVETFEIETKQESSSLAGQILERKRSAAVSDSVGRAEISKTGDKNAAAAANRVVGANIVDGRFVYVRGLGERYTNSLLDGATLPSPEPDRQTVPLDLFPSLMLDSVNIAKTFTPDYPGDFAGGSVRIQTRRMPEKFTFSIGASIGANVQSTFRNGLSYQGSSTDWLGFDSGARALPETIPDYRIRRGERVPPNNQFITNNQLQTYGRDINAFMSTERSLVPPNHGLTLSVGNTFDLGEGQKLGTFAALTYSREFEQRRDEIIRSFNIDETTETGFKRRNDIKAEVGADKVRWGALGGVTYAPSEANRFHLTGLYSRLSDDVATELEGFHAERTAVIHETRLSYVARGLAFGQLRGEHEIEDMAKAKVDWNAYIARADREEPDTRATVWELDSQFGYKYEDDSQSGLHFYSDQFEQSAGGGLDYTQPLSSADNPPKIKVGSLISVREREFDSRRFRYRPAPGVTSPVCAVQQWDPTCPDQIFATGNIGPVLQIEETTQGTDAYSAGLHVYAGYIMVDTPLNDQFRFIGGTRIEASKSNIDSFDRFQVEEPIATELSDEALLPGGALVWSPIQSINLRAAVSRTIARPQLRELSPFTWSNYFGGYVEQGNPDLKNTRILNVDVRSEFFPTLREVLAVSVFYKRFEDPIERFYVDPSGQGTVSYANFESGQLVGVEFEARKSFDIFTDALEDLSLIGNLTLSQSKIEIDRVKAPKVTNTDRPMANQAPWIINLALDYDNEDTGTRARVQYNITGPAIVTVGNLGLPDFYEQPRHRLDIVASQELVDGLDLKASAKNIINSPVRETLGPDNDDELVLHEYTTGQSFSLGLSYTY